MIAIPTLGSIRPELTVWLLQYGVFAAEIIDIPITGIPLSVSRNRIVSKFLASGCQKLWMIESYTLPPNDAAQMLFIDWPIISAPYQSGKHDDDYEIVDCIDCGCLIIDRRVFDKIERPYFETVPSPNGEHVVVNDGLWFRNKANAAGIKPLLASQFPCLNLQLNPLPEDYPAERYLTQKEHI